MEKNNISCKYHFNMCERVGLMQMRTHNVLMQCLYNTSADHTYRRVHSVTFKFSSRACIMLVQSRLDPFLAEKLAIA